HQAFQATIGILAVLFTECVGSVSLAGYVDKRRDAILWNILPEGAANLTAEQLDNLKSQFFLEWTFGYICAILLALVLLVIAVKLRRRLPNDVRNCEFSTRFAKLKLRFDLAKLVSLVPMLVLAFWVIGLISDRNVIRTMFGP